MVSGANRIELTVFDHTINSNIAAGTALPSGTILTEIKLSSVTGSFQEGLAVAWSGFASSTSISGSCLPSIRSSQNLVLLAWS